MRIDTTVDLQVPGIPAPTRIRIVASENAIAIIDLPTNQGRSLTNAYELAAKRAIRETELDPEEVRWFECDSAGDWDEVILDTTGIRWCRSSYHAVQAAVGFHFGVEAR